MSNEDFVSFENALRDLNMRSEELRKLVSEGEIRAFRDGESMKFRREDISSLQLDRTIDDDTLEDDTGMVTEELSDEDTLLVADEEVLEEVTVATPVAATATARATRARKPAESSIHPPKWVTAAAVLTAIMMIYGVMVCYSLATEAKVSKFNTLMSFKKAEQPPQ